MITLTWTVHVLLLITSKRMLTDNLFFRTFLYDDYAEYLKIKKKSIDHFSYWWKSFKFPSIVTQATCGQEGHCLGVAGVHDAGSYRGDAVRGGGVYVQDATHGARHGHATPGVA